MKNINCSLQISLVFLATVLLREVNIVTGCKCAVVSLKDRLCSNDFAGVVRVTGDGSQDSNCVRDDKCSSIEVLQSWKGDWQPNLLTTFKDSATCGVYSGVPSSGIFIASGYISNGAKGIRLASCSFVLKAISSVDDPAVGQYKEMLTNCPSRPTF